MTKVDGRRGAMAAASPSDARLAQASGERPLTRVDAERLLAALLRRVRTINADGQFAYRVDTFVVFGSVLTDDPAVTDVDVAVALVPRADDEKTHWRHCDARIIDAWRRGQRFRSIGDEESWPQREVLRALKGRSRGVSLHDISAIVALEGPTRILVERGVAVGQPGHGDAPRHVTGAAACARRRTP